MTAQVSQEKLNIFQPSLTIAELEKRNKRQGCPGDRKPKRRDWGFGEARDMFDARA